jgi:hypothetical protein
MMMSQLKRSPRPKRRRKRERLMPHQRPSRSTLTKWVKVVSLLSTTKDHKLLKEVAEVAVAEVVAEVVVIDHKVIETQDHQDLMQKETQLEVPEVAEVHKEVVTEEVEVTLPEKAKKVIEKIELEEPAEETRKEEKEDPTGEVKVRDNTNKREPTMLLLSQLKKSRLQESHPHNTSKKLLVCHSMTSSRDTKVPKRRKLELLKVSKVRRQRPQMEERLIKKLFKRTNTLRVLLLKPLMSTTTCSDSVLLQKMMQLKAQEEEEVAEVEEDPEEAAL